MFTTKIISLSIVFNMVFLNFFNVFEVFERFEFLFDTLLVSSAESVVNDDTIVVYEAETMTEIVSQNRDEVMPMGHLAKVMTLLITAEEVENGEISIDSIVTVSKSANAMQGTQIWLDVGEKISVDDLIKSITVGNANDACVALAESVANTEADFVERMNVKAYELGMESTYFADSTGVSDATISTAGDIAFLAAELSKHEWLFEYMTTWLENVRTSATELVNTNRLVRSYNGIIGMKACYSDKSGNCLVAAAQRNNMTLICVILGRDDEESRFSDARDALNANFAAYEVYKHEFDEEILGKIKVNCGEKLNCDVHLDKNNEILIPSGSSSDITVTYQRVPYVKAPVSENTIIGEVSLELYGKTVYNANIVTSYEVNVLSIWEAYRRLLLELLNI